MRFLCLLLALSTLPGIVAADRSTELVSGTLDVLVADDFETGEVKHLYHLRDDATGLDLELRSDSPLPDRLRSGDRVVLRGRVRDGVLDLSRSAPIQQVAPAPKAAMAGDRRSIVLIVDFADATVSCSNSTVASLMFIGTRSVDDLFRTVSDGLLGFPRDSNLDGLTDVYRVSLPVSAQSSCNHRDWADAADAAASGQGIDLSVFQHRIYVLPRDAGCNWAGLGSLGCFGWCRTWVKYCDLEDIYAHELGHNLGMHHASTDSNMDGTVDCEYCDRSDFMGIGGVGWREINGPHRDQLGWLPGNQVVDVSGDAVSNHVLSPLELDPTTAPFPQMLRIPRPATSDTLFISYRRRVGYDDNLSSSYADRTNLHTYRGGSTNTLYLDSLTDGTEFVDPVTGVSVRQISHGNDSVSLQVWPAAIPPGPAVDVAASVRRRSVVVLSWNAAQGGTAPVVAYRVYRDGQLVGTTDRMRFLDRSATMGQLHGYHIVSVDDDGLTSPASDMVQADLTGTSPGPRGVAR